jgi:putative endonuclease
MAKTYFVYIMASRRNGTLYTGVTNDLARRATQHRDGNGSTFTRTYNISRLVWAEPHDDINLAIVREKAIKKWRRAWKLELIERVNPDWDDLYETLNA